MEAQGNKHIENSRGSRAWIFQIVFATLTAGLLLFLSAGKLDWAGGWAFFGLNLLTQLLSSFILIPRRPDLLAERSKVREGTKSWDRFFAPAIMVMGTLALIVTAGLDARFGWSRPINPAIWWAAIALALAAQVFVLWAMATNRFFATTVRIQEERCHQAITAGPYRLVRHPGYAGSILYTLVIPVVLGSLWTFIPAVLTVALLVVRTYLEDRTLLTELPGYREYAARTTSRLIPRVW